MKIYFLGTCSGTEPMEGGNHSSFVIERGEKLYFFDAGEGCSRTAHLLGLDLLKVKKVIISHPHMDHVGGLANLLWTIRKLSKVKKNNPKHGDIEVHIPVLDTFEGVMKLLKNAEGGYINDYQTIATKVVDGVVFDDGDMRVTAFHNNHLKQNEETGDWRSFSFRIETEGKTLVYSGDVMGLADLDPVIADGADAVIVETGHHKIESVYEYLKNKNVDKVYYSHHGRAIINFPDEAEEKVQTLFNGKAVICYDGMIVDL